MTTTASHRCDLATAVAAAVRAPSVHNTQPWRFRLLDDAVEVYADRSRQLSVSDPEASALRVSCGAAILNLRLAVAHFGFDSDVRLVPDWREPDLLARVSVGPQRPPTPVQTALYGAIGKRHSNRSPFLDTAVPADVRARLIQAARAEGAWLDLLIGPQALAMVAELVRAADRVLVSDDAYRDELARWTRHEGKAADGVPSDVGGPAPEPYDLLPQRDFHGRPRALGRDYESDPLIGVIGSNGDSPLDDLVAGQALQSVLLTATCAGLATSLISQPIGVARIREQLRIGLRRYGTPHMLLRTGYGVPGSPTPRRPIADVMLPTLEPQSRPVASGPFNSSPPTAIAKPRR
jgi:nitroreductase